MVELNPQEFLVRLEAIERSMERSANIMARHVNTLDRTAESLSLIVPSNHQLEYNQGKYRELITRYADDLKKISEAYADEVRAFSRSLEATSDRYANEMRSWSIETGREESHRFVWAQIIAAAAVVVSVIALVITLIRK